MNNLIKLSRFNLTTTKNFTKERVIGLARNIVFLTVGGYILYLTKLNNAQKLEDTQKKQTK
jgi:MFS-type transporter involved in bile tolerance (Atg22 family)